MDNNPGHKWTDRLRRWLRGEARAADERQLDRAAAGDDFLREALDGYRRWPAGEHAERIDRLKARLAGRTRRRGGLLLLSWPRAAAAAALLLGLGAAWWLLRPAPVPAEAVAQVAGTAAEATAPETTAPPPADSTLALVEPPPPPVEKVTPRIPRPAPRKAPPAPPPPTSEHPAADLATKAPPPASAAAAPPAEAIEEAPAQEIAALQERKKSAAPESGFALRSLTTTAAPADTLYGRVANPAGRPLAGAIVQWKNAPGRALSDTFGRFALPRPAEQQSLVISAPGFSTREIQLDRPPADSLHISLREDSPPAPAAFQPPPFPQPRGGFTVLENHIRLNLRYPAAARQRGVQGIVRLEFQVRADGTLNDFRVRQSLGYGCDEEAIRLLRNGPAWSLPPGSSTPQTAGYEVVFRLE